MSNGTAESLLLSMVDNSLDTYGNMSSFKKFKISFLQRPKLGQSVGALCAGFIAVAILSSGTDSLMHTLGIFPPWNTRMPDALFFMAFSYRLIYQIGGSFLVAQLSPDKPLEHAMVSGAAGTVVSFFGILVAMNAGPEFGPMWYPIALAISALPCAWLGGSLLQSLKKE